MQIRLFVVIVTGNVKMPPLGNLNLPPSGSTFAAPMSMVSPMAFGAPVSDYVEPMASITKPHINIIAKETPYYQHAKIDKTTNTSDLSKQIISLSSSLDEIMKLAANKNANLMISAMSSFVAADEKGVSDMVAMSNVSGVTSMLVSSGL